MALIPTGTLVVLNSVSSRGLKVYKIVGVTKSNGRFSYRLGKANHLHRYGSTRVTVKNAPESQLIVVHPRDPGVLRDTD